MSRELIKPSQTSLNHSLTQRRRTKTVKGLKAEHRKNGSTEHSRNLRGECALQGTTRPRIKNKTGLLIEKHLTVNRQDIAVIAKKRSTEQHQTTENSAEFLKKGNSAEFLKKNENSAEFKKSGHSAENLKSGHSAEIRKGRSVEIRGRKAAQIRCRERRREHG